MCQISYATLVAYLEWINTLMEEERVPKIEEVPAHLKEVYAQDDLIGRELELRVRQYLDKLNVPYQYSVDLDLAGVFQFPMGIRWFGDSASCTL